MAGTMRLGLATFPLDKREVLLITDPINQLAD